MNVNLESLLTHKRSTLLKKWFNRVIETYPPETALFLRSQKDRFSNPVGSLILRGIEDIFGELLQEIDYEKVSTFLDNIIRVRAVQDFTPSQAISFIFLLKKVIRDELEKEIKENGLSKELLALESRIDELALISFDIFMKCREKIYELKAMELNNQTYSLLKRAKLIIDLEEQEGCPRGDNTENL
ncbi:MAG: RsbRD N-terminal domain-containing protein [Nitrospirota bacterium]